MKGVLTKTGYKLSKKTGMLGNKRSTQEGREGNSQEDDKGNSQNSCAAGIEDTQPGREQGQGTLGRMSPEREMAIFSYLMGLKWETLY